MSTDSRTLYVAEPAAQYLVRPPVVIDCSVLVAFLFREPSLQLATAKIDGRSLKAPYLLNIEVASVALKKKKQGMGEFVDAGVEAMTGIEIELFDVKTREAFTLALRYKLSACDAAYLWLAADLKCPLATFDEKLAKAAKEHLASLP